MRMSSLLILTRCLQEDSLASITSKDGRHPNWTYIDPGRLAKAPQE
jgi:hypothetical protein